jgi:ubiquinone/menaquinone biosynthesis C-methylase UbiE/DNA-binding transcriptional ArsR family regulator
MMIESDPTHAYESLAHLCKAAGDPLRLNVLRVLSNDSFGVLELSQIFAIGQSGMSHHLKVLTQAGLLSSRREGNAIFYRRALSCGDSANNALQAALFEEVDRLPLPEALQARITEIHQQRAQISQHFFMRNAAHFQSQQDLIASPAHYQDSLLSLLDTLDFSQGATALEVGPGDGNFLPPLAQRFQQVFAVDNCPQMLELARVRCQREQLNNVELQLADALTEPSAAVDCVVLNMVLHHFAAPAEAMQLLAQRIKAGGSLLITDLCRHDQGWAQSACGDLWLGFDQEELGHWANNAGLCSGESLYIGLRNGFQIQIRHFHQPLVPLSHRTIGNYSQ